PHPRPDRRAARLARDRAGRGVGGVPAGQRRGRVGAAAPTALHAAPGPRRPPHPLRDRRGVSGRELDPGGVRADARCARPTTGRRGHRDRVGRRRGDDAPRGMDQPEGRLLPDAEAPRVRRAAARGPVEGVAGRPAHRARDRGAQPLSPARRSRADARDVRCDVAPHRDALRSLRPARPGRPLPCPLLGRELPRGRHALGREPGAGRRRPPVGDHARHRGRAAGDRLLRAGLRAGGRVDPPRRAPRPRRPDGRERVSEIVDEAGGPVPRAAAEPRVPRVRPPRGLPLDRRPRRTRLGSGGQRGPPLRRRRDGPGGDGPPGRLTRERLRRAVPGLRRHGIIRATMATLTESRKRELQRDLEAIVGPGAVLSDPEELLVYESDGLTLFRALADFVVFPTSAEHVAAVVRLANRAELPFVARGAGTGLSGGCLPAEGGIVLSMMRMNRVLEVDYDNQLAVVEPGLVNLHLSSRVGPKGYYYAPDPSSQQACTIGGNIANNSGGLHTLKYGVTTNHVLGLEVVMPDAEIVWLGGKTREAPGYDLAGVFVGSEGTVGIATKVVVRILKKPQAGKPVLAVV